MTTTLVALLIAAAPAAAITVAAPADAKPCTPAEWKQTPSLCKLQGTLDGVGKYADGLEHESEQIEQAEHERAENQRRAWMLGGLVALVVAGGGLWWARRRVSAGFGPVAQAHTPNTHAQPSAHDYQPAPPYAPEADAPQPPPPPNYSDEETRERPRYVRSERVDPDDDDGDDSNPFAGVV